MKTAACCGLLHPCFKITITAHQNSHLQEPGVSAVPRVKSFVQHFGVGVCASGVAINQFPSLGGWQGLGGFTCHRLTGSFWARMLCTGNLAADFSSLASRIGENSAAHPREVSQKTFLLDSLPQQCSRVTCLAATSLLQYFTSPNLRQKVLEELCAGFQLWGVCSLRPPKMGQIAPFISEFVTFFLPHFSSLLLRHICLSILWISS